MNIRLRRPASRFPGFPDIYALLTLGLLAGVPAAGWLGLSLPGCRFRDIFGIPCPTCGYTRALLSLGRLDLAGATAAQPFACLLACAGIGFAALVLGPRIAGREVRFEIGRHDLILLRIGLPLLLAGSWGWNLLAGN